MAIIIFEDAVVVPTILRKIYMNFNVIIEPFLSIHSQSFFCLNTAYICNFVFTWWSWFNLTCFVWARFLIWDSWPFAIVLTWNAHSLGTEKLVFHHKSTIVFNDWTTCCEQPNLYHTKRDKWLLNVTQSVRKQRQTLFIQKSDGEWIEKNDDLLVSISYWNNAF